MSGGGGILNPRGLRADQIPMESQREHAQSGFTLLELLVVIAVLSVVAGGAVFAVGSMREHSQDVACSVDQRALETAEQALAAATGSVGDEALLVSSGYLDAASEYHDIVVAGDDYTIVAVGPCVTDGGGPVEVAGPPDPDAAAPAPPEPAAVKPEADLEAAPAKGCAKGQVDINSAGAVELQQIKHIGEVRAQLVIEARPFGSVEQLDRVKGIGPSRVADILEQNVACVK